MNSIPARRDVPLMAMRRPDAKSLASSARRTCRIMSPGTGWRMLPGIRARPPTSADRSRPLRRRGVSLDGVRPPGCGSRGPPRAFGGDVTSRRDPERRSQFESRKQCRREMLSPRGLLSRKGRMGDRQSGQRFLVSSMISIQSWSVRSSRFGLPSFGRSSSR